MRFRSGIQNLCFQCWRDYEVSWQDCGVTTLMLPSPSYVDPGPPAKWLFRELYDGSANLLGGDCLTGQLIEEGYLQEVSLGRLLRASYIGKGGLHLFADNDWARYPLTQGIRLSPPNS